MNKCLEPFKEAKETPTEGPYRLFGTEPKRILAVPNCTNDNMTLNS